MQPLYYDLIIALVLLLSMWLGHRRGFILTFCGFLAVFVALFGATFLSDMLKQPVSRLVQPAIEQHLTTLFDSMHAAEPEPYTFPEISTLPEILVEKPSEEDSPSYSLSISLEDALDDLKQTPFYSAFSSAIRSALAEGRFTLTANVVQSVAGYIALELTQVVLFVIFFVLILIVWFFLSHALDLAFRLPVLSTLNHWSGAALGLFRGAFLVFIACQVLKGRFLSEEVLTQSILLHFFCTVNPLLYFAKLKFITSSYL